MPNVKGLFADPQFNALDPVSQKAVLAGIDPQFKNLSDSDFATFRQGIGVAPPPIEPVKTYGPSQSDLGRARYMDPMAAHGFIQSKMPASTVPVLSGGGRNIAEGAFNGSLPQIGGGVMELSSPLTIGQLAGAGVAAATEGGLTGFLTKLGVSALTGGAAHKTASWMGAPGWAQSAAGIIGSMAGFGATGKLAEFLSSLPESYAKDHPAIALAKFVASKSSPEAEAVKAALKADPNSLYQEVYGRAPQTQQELFQAKGLAQQLTSQGRRGITALSDKPLSPPGTNTNDPLARNTPATFSIPRPGTIAPPPAAAPPPIYQPQPGGFALQRGGTNVGTLEPLPPQGLNTNQPQALDPASGFAIPRSTTNAPLAPVPLPGTNGPVTVDANSLSIPRSSTNILPNIPVPGTNGPVSVSPDGFSLARPGTNALPPLKGTNGPMQPLDNNFTISRSGTNPGVPLAAQPATSPVTPAPSAPVPPVGAKIANPTTVTQGLTPLEQQLTDSIAAVKAGKGNPLPANGLMPDLNHINYPAEVHPQLHPAGPEVAITHASNASAKDLAVANRLMDAGISPAQLDAMPDTDLNAHYRALGYKNLGSDYKPGTRVGRDAATGRAHLRNVLDGLWNGSK